MDQHQIQAALRDIANLSAFARQSKIPRRTLERIKAGERSANATTLMLVETALRRYKPAKKE